jgi:uncharacterized protein
MKGLNGMDRYSKAKKFIVEKLETELPSNLYYHGFHHVLDVLQSAQRLGEMEKINEKEMEMLCLAALFHDSGFIISSKDHELNGCKLVRENLLGFGYSENEIETICGMIMATKFPQQPKNLLEELICDADLDYLGRDDFFNIGNTLYRELRDSGVITNENEWNKLQESFLTTHRYFTKSARDIRKAKKDEHLNQIRTALKIAD